jgi:hypothetical protein
MRKRAAEYQTRVTDQSANRSYKVKNTKFDGYKNGKLIEAKANYKQFINKKENVFHEFFQKKGQKKLLDQAARQVEAANGTPIQWICKDKELVNVLKKLFAANTEKGLHLIELIHHP